ncbi:hypothetical protein EIP91_008128 [Steccherinum ochraceum]|uniref:Six-hairpin glycosidase-like protein n=1 Tax=Steccherinum ochraceum TaxID=92696 RepID=A0A4R0R388_9APHY|nr:hypothetical protein EIP91_008128 [Steccherinum ochraceum]
MGVLRSSVVAIALSSILLVAANNSGSIDRHAVVSRYNPTRNASSQSTPVQVGNGGFAFGADVTGLQTFLPYATLSSWGWKNDSLPAGKTQTDIDNYEGAQWPSHGRDVQYMFDGEPTMLQWMIANPNRVNLGQVGLLFSDGKGNAVNVAETDLAEVEQDLDLWTGTISSSFVYQGKKVTVKTTSAQSSDAIGVTVTSPLVESGHLGIFLDFPWNDGSQKFAAPFVGVFNQTSNHTTTLRNGRGLGRNVQAEISHTQVNSTFLTSVGGDGFAISRVSPSAHRYNILASNHRSSSFSVTVAFSAARLKSIPQPVDVANESKSVWTKFWSSTGFIDVHTGSTDTRADELQRRIVLSRYWLRVNEAGDTPPQESGLVNNGWYGKFHMEMVFWHLAHWALWNNWELLDRSIDVYSRFLQTSLQRAQVQEGFASGARWSKMTDPTGRSAPGEINELLIWQQPHPLIFAQYDYRAHKSRATLNKWKDVVRETANFMASFAWFNQSSGFYDLGPTMYTVAEDTNPNITRNAAFELSYWRFGLDLAGEWFKNLGEKAPSAWKQVTDKLAPLPVENGLYAVYEGIEPDFWTDPTYINDHPSLAGLHGWLPLTANVSLDIAKATADKAFTSWNISNCWGWDFPMLAMSAARNGETDQAVDWLLHPLFEFDDIGMPVGGVRVPTPYFPGSSALLYAVAMMAEGWDGSNTTAPGFPSKSKGWNVRAEGISKAL